jgi:2-hydroxychromene-2-carboxylate isomerase
MIGDMSAGPEDQIAHGGQLPWRESDRNHASREASGRPEASLEFWSDFLSPYGYIGAAQVEAIAARHGRTVRWRPILLGITVMKVMGLKPLTETPLKADYLKRDLPRLATLFGVEYRPHGIANLNSVAASRALIWVTRHAPARVADFALAMYRRLWVRGEDITPPEAAVAEAVALGLDGAALSAWLASEEAKAALKAEVEEGIAKGVFGAPFFLVEGEPIWGADRLWMLERFLRDGGWKPL